MTLATEGDPRVAEILRRRTEKNGATHSPAPSPLAIATPEPRKLDDAGRDEIRRLAGANPKWSASDLADAFEGEHGWRPSYQGIGRALAEPAPRRSARRKPAHRKATPAADPEAEVDAIAAVSRALAPLDAGQVRRVLAWARDRFEAGEEGGDS